MLTSIEIIETPNRAFEVGVVVFPSGRLGFSVKQLSGPRLNRDECDQHEIGGEA